jgi:hypothetical protein
MYVLFLWEEKKDRNSRQKLLSFNLLTVSSFDKGLKNAHGE